MENEDVFAGIAFLKDGSTQIKSGTLDECAEWEDDVRRENEIKEIVIKVVPK